MFKWLKKDIFDFKIKYVYDEDYDSIDVFCEFNMFGIKGISLGDESKMDTTLIHLHFSFLKLLSVTVFVYLLIHSVYAITGLKLSPFLETGLIAFISPLILARESLNHFVENIKKFAKS